MTDAPATARLSPEGRVVIPAEFRRRMGLHAGDVVHFGFDEQSGRLEIFTAQHLVDVMWAHNQGGDAVDVADDVRRHRLHDQETDIDSEARHAAETEEPWDEGAATARLLDALHLT